MAQRNQLAGFLGPLYAGNAGNAQHIALFGVALGDQFQGGRKHLDAAACHCNPVGIGFCGYVHHMGLSVGVEVGEVAHNGHFT